MNHTMLSKDTRPIQTIFIGDDYQRRHDVGQYGVTKITAVDETGEMAYVPWFEVWRGDALYVRVNSAFVGEVYYQEGTELGRK